MVAMMSEEDEDGNDEVQQSIKKKLQFLLRTAADYKLERMQREQEVKDGQKPASACSRPRIPDCFTSSSVQFQSLITSPRRSLPPL